MEARQQAAHLQVPLLTLQQTLSLHPLLDEVAWQWGVAVQKVALQLVQMEAGYPLQPPLPLLLGQLQSLGGGARLVAAFLDLP
jgi:hypothetical protein